MALDIVHMMMSDIRHRGQEQVQGPGEPGPGPGEREQPSMAHLLLSEAETGQS